MGAEGGRLEKLREVYPEVESEVLEFMSDVDEEEFEEEAFNEEEAMSSVILIDNLPKVPLTKYDKLGNVLKKIFGQTGTIRRFEMPVEKDQTIGTALMELSSSEEANTAVKLTDGYALDKLHKLKVNNYYQFIKLQDLEEEWTPKPKTEFLPRLNPHSWLSDSRHRDQLAVRYNNETEVLWVEKGGAPRLEYGGEREKEGGLYWCEMCVQWSSRGSLLATFHNKGIALWGDSEFSKQGRFAHQGVRLLDFSPLENYMITYNSKPGDKRGVVVWDIRNKREIRSFEHIQLARHIPSPLVPTEKSGPSLNPKVFGASSVHDDPYQPLGLLSAAAAAGERLTPPGGKEQVRFQWSFDDKYCARRGVSASSGQRLISIYELPSMQLLEKKSLKADGVVDFQWSPAANILAYWAPEQGNSPARVTLVEIPSRKELRQRNLVNVSDCSLYWHPDGMYLCVKVLRHTKSKKTIFSALELFRVDEALVPVEIVELKDPILAFAWEPNGGHRFAVIYQPEGSTRPDVAFYSMLSADGKRKEVTKIHSLSHRPCNSLFWSPMGSGHIVLAGLGDGYDGALEFVDLESKWNKQIEHYRCTHVAWDPSGRVVATSVVQPLEGAFFKFQMDNGYKLWTFQGQLFHEASFENMYQLVWRPRPKSLLDDTQKKQIIKNLRKYERRFANEDKLQELARQRELSKEKRQMRAKYRNLINDRIAKAQANLRQARIAMRNGVDADDDTFYIVTTTQVETVVSSKEEFSS